MDAASYFPPPDAVGGWRSLRGAAEAQREAGVGHAFYVVSSLDLARWKLGGRDDQYAPENTGLPIHPEAVARDGWVASTGDDAAIETLRRVVASVLRP